MFINEGGCVISCADGGIFKFLTASMCDNSKVHDIIKAGKEANKEE